MKQQIKRSILWLLFAGFLAGCGGSNTGTSDNSAAQNLPDHYSYVFRSPYIVQDFGTSPATTITDFSLVALQTHIDNSWKSLSVPGQDNILNDSAMNQDLRDKIDWIDAPLANEDGYADTVIHAFPGITLTQEDVDSLKLAFHNQYHDGWGDYVEQMYFEINSDGDEYSVCLANGVPSWSIDLFGDYCSENDPQSGDTLITPCP